MTIKQGTVAAVVGAMLVGLVPAKARAANDESIVASAASATKITAKFDLRSATARALASTVGERPQAAVPLPPAAKSTRRNAAARGGGGGGGGTAMVLISLAASAGAGYFIYKEMKKETDALASPQPQVVR